MSEEHQEIVQKEEEIQQEEIPENPPLDFAAAVEPDVEHQYQEQPEDTEPDAHEIHVPLDSSEVLPAAIPAAGDPVEIKLFVGRVPKTAGDEVLLPLFQEFGPVLEVIVIKDKATQLHKGSAFVRMASISQADSAIRGLNNVKVLDPQFGPLQVRYATGEAEKLGLSQETANPGMDQAKLFVGSLLKNVTETEIRGIFEPYGKVDEIFIMKDNTTGQGKGCAFVKFGFKEQAIQAIRALNGSYTCPGAPRAIEVRFAEAKKPLVPGVTAMLPMGMGAPRPAAPIPAPSNTNPRTVGAWKEFFTAEGRPYYHNEMTQMTQWDRPMDFEQPAQVPRQVDITGPAGANVFIFHVPNDWSQDDLMRNFSQFGQVLSARIATDRTTGRNKGYAFVSYDNVNSSAAAVSQMNGFMSSGKRLKVSIKQGEEKYVQHLLPPLGAAPPMQQQHHGMPGGMPGTMPGAPQMQPQMQHHAPPMGGPPMGNHMMGGPVQGAYGGYGGYGTPQPGHRYAPY